MIGTHRHLKYSLTTPNKIILIRTILAFSIAAIDTIWSLYMDSFGMQDSTIGFINAALTAITILAALTLTPLLETFHEKKITKYSIYALITSCLGFMLSESILLFFLFALLYSISTSVRVTCLTILLRDNSTKKSFTKHNGLQGSLLSLGWFLGPVIAGSLLGTFGLSSVFLFSAGMGLLGLILFSRGDSISEKIHSKIIHKNILKNSLLYLKQKKTYLPSLMQIGIDFWWALIFIYVPLVMISQGLGPQYIGIFIGLTQLPLVLIENYAGKKAAITGFRTFFVLGFSLLGIAALSSFYITEIEIVLLLLVLASIAMAFIEAQPTAYFFSKISQKEEEILSPIFNLMPFVGSFLGKIVLAAFLIFFPQESIFMVTAIVMFIFAGIALVNRE